MKFEKPISVSEICEKYGLSTDDNKDTLAYGINEIHKVEAGDITYVDVEKYFDRSINSEASIIILNKNVATPNGKVLIVVDNPFEVYNKIVLDHRFSKPLRQNISDTAVIHPTATIEPNAIIGHHVKIGANSYIQAGAIIHSNTEIGENCMIQSGAIIGTDAFYYKRESNEFKPLISCGRVIIHDNVSIGASTTVNRGVSGHTVIGEGTKIDCQVHVGHGAVVGKNCLFAAQVGIGGKTIIHDNVILYGQVGIAQNLIIEENVTVLAKSGVSKNLEKGKTYFGYPASEASEKYKELAALRALPDFLNK